MTSSHHHHGFNFEVMKNGIRVVPAEGTVITGALLEAMIKHGYEPGRKQAYKVRTAKIIWSLLSYVHKKSA